ncbi:hypothetical protein DFR86_11260 [Acidianus sulfidivorans JP7]|uniref:Uncharacterized protein n=1 Tax=Acidianus sulfidivorans JP7 TaxID=619593 RepID=A0A2U9IPW8_9CREN|nr:hypothetical protein [Acidianus sulfidivorans]AWR98055.1 hypothetical protein DFR86_11260 [Acidianus sulfidivorans JP7]
MYNKINKQEIAWLISGVLAGIGYIFATFYFMIIRKDESRWLGLMFLLGPIGSILVYFIARKEYKDLSLISIYLLVGFLIWVPIALLFGINPLYQFFGYIHGWLGD